MSSHVGRFAGVTRERAPVGFRWLSVYTVVMPRLLTGEDGKLSVERERAVEESEADRVNKATSYRARQKLSNDV